MPINIRWHVTSMLATGTMRHLCVSLRISCNGILFANTMIYMYVIKRNHGNFFVPCTSIRFAAVKCSKVSVNMMVMMMLLQHLNVLPPSWNASCDM